MAAASHSRKTLDLTGQRFGRLTAIARAENINGRTAWLCRCDCGRQAVVKTQHLRSGCTISCGCAIPPVGPEGGLNLTYIDGTCVEMLRARTVRRNNTSGVPGVDWLKSKHAWRAAICFKGRRYYLGCYHSFEEAVAARKKAEASLHDDFLKAYDEAAALRSQAI